MENLSSLNMILSVLIMMITIMGILYVENQNNFFQNFSAMVLVKLDAHKKWFYLSEIYLRNKAYEGKIFLLKDIFLMGKKVQRRYP